MNPIVRNRLNEVRARYAEMREAQAAVAANRGNPMLVHALEMARIDLNIAVGVLLDADRITTALSADPEQAA